MYVIAQLNMNSNLRLNAEETINAINQFVTRISESVKWDLWDIYTKSWCGHDVVLDDMLFFLDGFQMYISIV